MTREEFIKHRQATLKVVIDIVKNHKQSWHPPSYKTVVAKLNSKGLRTAWGNEWTMPRLCMFLNRMGYVGLYGVLRRQQSE